MDGFPGKQKGSGGMKTDNDLVVQLSEIGRADGAGSAARTPRWAR
jgi:hypothetical protein